MTETSYLDNRLIRIFISSTFKDMQAERGYLVTKVFPALRRYCEERDVSIFELDLRWGISEEEAKQGKVFEICLNEVLKTRPFFIGLLGERYGWVPSEEERKAIKENTDVFEDYPWIADELAKGVSITEIEIQEGVLRSEEKMNAYFYFRSPKMVVAEEFREKAGSHEEKMLLQLKNTLKKQNVYPIKEYDSIEALGSLVEKDFKALVDGLFPKGALSPLEKERQQQHNFLKSRTRVYVPNPDWYAKLDEFAKSEEKAMVITGESGIGKSALIANWVAKRQEQKNEKIICHFIGMSQSEGNFHKITQRLIDEIRSIYNIPAEEHDKEKNSLKQKTEADKQYNELQNLLYSLPKKKKLIIALDGIEKLLDTENAKLLNWIPPIPDNVKIIFSTLPDDPSMEALNLRGYPQFGLDALPIESRKELINEYLKSFGKTLSPERVDRIALDKENENPLVLLTILDELRVFGVHEEIDSQIDHYLDAPDTESLFDLVLQRVEETFSEGNAQKNLVKDILSLITVSRNGLSETEILELSRAAPLYWSQLFNGMSGHLTTMNGLVSFSNSMIFNAAKKRYTSDSAAEEPYRRRIAVYMEKQKHVSFNRKCDELPYQLFELKEWDKLQHFLFDPNAFLYIYKKDRYELGKYWRVLREIVIEVEDEDSHIEGSFFFNSNKYISYSPEDCFDLERIDDTWEETEDALLFYEHMYFLFIDILADYSVGLNFAKKNMEIREKLYGKYHHDTAASYDDICVCYFNLTHANTQECIDNIVKAAEYFRKYVYIKEKLLGENHTDTAFYNKVGDRLSELHFFYYAGLYEDSWREYDYVKIFENYNKALAINEKLFGKNHPDTAVSYDNIGGYYLKMSNHEENKKALEYYNEALAIREKIFGKDDPAIAVSYDNIGDYYLKKEDYEKALKYYNDAIIIRKKALGKNHPDTASSYNKIGECYLEQKNYEKALECYNEALAIREELFGKNHPNTAESYHNVGTCYYGLSDYSKALEYYNKALAIREKILGKEHYDTIHSYRTLSNYYNNLGDYKNAIENYEELLDFGLISPVESRTQMGDYYYNLGDYNKALEYYDEVLAIEEDTKEVFEEDIYLNNTDLPVRYISINDKIGNCYYGLGDYSKALEFYNKALSIREKVLGKNDPDIAASYNKIGECYSNLGDNEKALEYFKQALAVCDSPEGRDAITENINRITELLAKK